MQTITITLPRGTTPKAKVPELKTYEVITGEGDVDAPLFHSFKDMQFTPISREDLPKTIQDWLP